MSFIPLMFSEWWEGLDEPHKLPAQNFALQVDPDKSKAAICETGPGRFYRHPWQMFRNFYLPRKVTPMEEGEQGLSVVKADKEKFQVALDIQQFTPDEIKVKVINNYVLVEGKHEEKPDEHGSITRHFIRKYLVPEQCDIDKVTACLSADGVLTLNAPRKQGTRSSEREIEIELIGKRPVAEEKPSVDDTEKFGSEKIEDKTTAEDLQMKTQDEVPKSTDDLRSKPTVAEERPSVDDTEKLGFEEIEDQVKAQDKVPKSTDLKSKLDVTEERPSLDDTEKLRTVEVEDKTTTEDQGIKARDDVPRSTYDLRSKSAVAEERPSVDDTEKLGFEDIGDQIKPQDKVPKSVDDFKSKVKLFNL